MIDAAQASMIWCVGRGAQEADSTAHPARATAASGDPGRVFAVTAYAYHNVATSSRKRAGAAVIDDTMAERMVACGWIAASLAGVFMIALALMVGFGLGWVYLAGAGILFALAYGIFRRSRICAVLVLANHLLGVAGLFARARYVPSVEVAMALLLGVLYVLGVIGTFVHHARRRAA
jgi:hypothetical protein